MQLDEYWNNIYQSGMYGLPEYDGWLDKYLSLLRRSKSIIDLGCGNGVDTVALSKNNIKVVSCDISDSVLQKWLFFYYIHIFVFIERNRYYK